MNLKLLKIARFFHLIKKEKYNEKRQIEIVKKSPFFDAKWYLAQNPDVRAKKIGAARHYVRSGWKEGRNPGPNFNTNDYLREYPELFEKNCCPLFHYIENSLEKMLKKNATNCNKKNKFSGDLFNYDIFPDVQVDLLRPQVINIFIPSISASALTAGPLGILYLGKTLLNLGLNVRFFVLKDMDISCLNSEPDLKILLEKAEFQCVEDRDGTIFINPQDKSVATLWLSAYFAEYLQSFCADKSFIYMIQDYETIFYPNSSISALIENTYKMNFLGLFSTVALKDFFYKRNIQNIRKRKIPFCIFNTVSSSFLPSYCEFKLCRGKKKQFVFYGRPHRARNMFELGCYVLYKAISANILNPEEWEFYSVGAKEDKMEIYPNVYMNSLPYMNSNDYKKRIVSFDLGLSLMESPHPSMVPIDLALSGCVVVTNSYANKDEKYLRSISKNILCCPTDVKLLLAKIQEALALTQKLEIRYANAKETQYPKTWEDTFNLQVKKWLLKYIKGDKK